MKLSAQQLPQHLNKAIAPLYVISSDDPLLAQEAIDLIRDAAKSAGFTERMRIHVDSGTDWGKALFTHTQSLSLFAAKRLFELDLTTAKLNATTSKIILEYAQSPSSDSVLVIHTHKLDGKSEQSHWYKTLEKLAIIIPIWPIPIEQLPTWILQRAKKLNINLTKAAADYLTLQVEGNLLAAAQELEKISLLVSKNESTVIDEKTIETIVTDNAHFDIFVLVDTALAGNSKRALRILKSLATEDTEPTLILWALTRELRTLTELSNHLEQGVGLGSLFSKYRIWEKRQSNVRAFLQRHKSDGCLALLTHAAHIDRIIKGAEIGNVWNALENVIISVCINSNKQ